MKEDIKKSFWSNYLWLVLVVAIVIVSIVTSTWSSIAHQDYLARLTPEERKQIADAKTQKQIQNDKNSQEAWNNFSVIFNYPVPIWFMLVFTSVTILALRNRHGGL